MKVMKIKVMICMVVFIPLCLTACNRNNSTVANQWDKGKIDETSSFTFESGQVHDPSVVKVGDAFYIFGSHLASAKTTDLMNWTQVSSGVQTGNKLIPDVLTDMAESLEWSQTNTFWAPDVRQLKDGKFYMYYCTCKGDSPLSTLGVARADNIEGPYKNLGIILKSGMQGISSETGVTYDATRDPNVVDPNTFFDKEGKLWMVYGSYSGGIFILKMNPDTGFPYPGQGYGKKMLGANHSRIEGPYILYNPQTDYYYLFLSFGGLDTNGGYNIRVVRSKTPDGPYYDAKGNDMINCHGAPGSFFDDASIEPFGVKLIGGYQFTTSDEKSDKVSTGYLSPGHNSAIRDDKTGKYFIIFHTRFDSRGEYFEDRVHQMFFNNEGWPVVAPQRYTGETIGKYTIKDVIGDYNLINHGSDISADMKKSVNIKLNKNNTISGSETGTWKIIGDNNVELTIEKVTYKGVLLRQWDDDNKSYVITFSALSDKGIAIWGSQVVKK
jgi:arabinan endo-1,5-alpha-L-arabinosidase